MAGNLPKPAPRFSLKCADSEPMPGPYTIDASVFINAFNPIEPGHKTSYNLLVKLQEGSIPLIAPTLLLPEVAAAISRGRRDSELARQFATALSRLHHLVLVPLDTAIAQQAVDVAADYRLRGSDAVYAAVSLRFVSTLITLDREQHNRVAEILATRYPEDALKDLSLD